MVLPKIYQLLIIFCFFQYIESQECIPKKIVSFDNYENGRLVGQEEWDRGSSCSEEIFFDTKWNKTALKSGYCYNGQGSFKNFNYNDYFQLPQNGKGHDYIYGRVRTFTGCCNKGTTFYLNPCLRYGITTGNHVYRSNPRLLLWVIGLENYLISSEGSNINEDYMQGLDINYDERKITAYINSSSHYISVETPMTTEFETCIYTELGIRMDGMGGGGIMDDIYTHSCPNGDNLDEESDELIQENQVEYISEYECFKQFKDSLLQVENEYFITATANTEGCPPNVKYSLKTIPSDIIISPLEVNYGNSFSVQIDS